MAAHECLSSAQLVRCTRRIRSRGDRQDRRITDGKCKGRLDMQREREGKREGWRAPSRAGSRGRTVRGSEWTGSASGRHREWGRRIDRERRRKQLGRQMKANRSGGLESHFIRSERLADLSLCDPPTTPSIRPAGRLTDSQACSGLATIWPLAAPSHAPPGRPDSGIFWPGKKCIYQLKMLPTE